MTEQIRAIQEYVYGKYIEPGAHGTLDEESAARTLDACYADPAHALDSECYFPGVLWFELGFELEDEETKKACFLRAYYWLKKSQVITQEEWDAVDDRVLDIEDWAEDQGISLETDPPPAVPVLASSGEGEPALVSAAPARAPHVVQEIEDHGPMMLIPSGTFLFGLDRRETHLPAFRIDKYPVTNQQYESFCRATGYRWPKFRGIDRLGNPDAPVVGVSVLDAEKFARWVGKSLPTEEQWEKACRGSDGRIFPWGNEIPHNGQTCHGRSPLDGGTDPVSAHPGGVSPYGVMDMAGNVWEWTRSTATDGGETVHLIKGGCYNDPPNLLRADIHMGQVPKDKFETIGFRCVKPS